MERREEERAPRAGQRPPFRAREGAHLGEERSLGDLFRELASETQALVRQELQLARIEVREIAAEAGQNAGLIAAGGFVAYAGFLAIVAGLGFLLGQVMALWLSFLIVGLAVLLIGYALYQGGRKGLRETDFSLERTTESLQEDKQWMKEEAQDVKRDPARLGARR